MMSCFFPKKRHLIDCLTLRRFCLSGCSKGLELTEVMRQRNDIEFIELLNQVRIGQLSPQNEELLKSCKIDRNDPDYPIDAIHIFAENIPVEQHNNAMLDSLQSVKYNIAAQDELPKDIKQINTISDFLANAKPSETGGLCYSISLKIGARIMISRNIDIEDKLVNGQVGKVMEFKLNGSKIEGIYIKLDDDTAGLKARNRDRLCRENNWIYIERTEATFSPKKNRYVVVKRTQFPLILSWACTCHKVQGLSLQSAVISFDLRNQKSFNAGQMYVALSRVTSLKKLYLIGNVSTNAIKVNKDVSKEYQRLREQSMFKPSAPIEVASVPPDHLRICLVNVRSLNKHAQDLSTYKTLMCSDIICLTETQLDSSSNVENVNNALHPYKIEYNNQAVSRFQNSALCSLPSVEICEFLKVAGFSLIKFRKDSFHFDNRPIKMLLIYRQPNSSRPMFYNDLAECLMHDDIDIILGDINIDVLDPSNQEILNVLSNYKLLVTEPTHIAGGLLDHVYVKNTSFKNTPLECVIWSLYFSDHDAVLFELL